MCLRLRTTPRYKIPYKWTNLCTEWRITQQTLAEGLWREVSFCICPASPHPHGFQCPWAPTTPVLAPLYRRFEVQKENTGDEVVVICSPELNPAHRVLPPQGPFHYEMFSACFWLHHTSPRVKIRHPSLGVICSLMPWEFNRKREEFNFFRLTCLSWSNLITPKFTWHLCKHIRWGRGNGISEVAEIAAALLPRQTRYSVEKSEQSQSSASCHGKIWEHRICNELRHYFDFCLLYQLSVKWISPSKGCASPDKKKFEFCISIRG